MISFLAHRLSQLVIVEEHLHSLGKPIYFVRLDTSEFTQVRRTTLLR